MSEPTGPNEHDEESPHQQYLEHEHHVAEVRRTEAHGLEIAIGIGLVVLIGIIISLVIFFKHPVTVPDMVTMTQSQAEQTIVDSGLRTGDVTKIATGAVGPGLVALQRPAMGESVLSGTQVDLVLAEQTQPAPAPGVTGMRQSDAEAKLISAQFVPLDYQQYSDVVPAGSVVEQLPSAGTRYRTGSQVVIAVSLGRAPVTSSTVPTLTGGDDSVASAALQSADLVGYWLFNTVSSERPGLVLEQLPNPGVQVPPGSQVAVWVAGVPQ